MPKKVTTEEWVQKARKVHGDRFDYSKVEYINNYTEVCIICSIHGEFWQTPRHHIIGKGCPKCSYESVSKSYKKPKEQFIKEAKKIHGDKYDYSKVEYNSSRDEITIICPEHGEFKQALRSHLYNKAGCPKCNRGVALTTEEWIEKARKVHGNKYNYNKVQYINHKTNIIIICPEHGEFLQMPQTHLSGYGCPKCRLKSQTKLFEKLKESFPNEEIIFEATNKVISWIEKQRIDIYFPKYNIAVEYNGKQHYIPVERFGGELKFEIQKERDELKRQKCKDNNCALFEMKYDYSDEDYNNLVNDINKIIGDTTRK